MMHNNGEYMISPLQQKQVEQDESVQSITGNSR